MKILVAYDVSTESAAGRRRLRRVAKKCGQVGQRVQKSLFECSGDRMQLEELERQLVDEINEKEDCLRIYLLRDEERYNAREYGKFSAVDFDEPLVV